MKSVKNEIHAVANDMVCITALLLHNQLKHEVVPYRFSVEIRSQLWKDRSSAIDHQFRRPTDLC